MNAHSPIELKVSTAQSALFHGDAFALVEQLPASSLDLVISSPPYNIGKEYERGMFSSLDAYKEKMETLIESLSSKLKDTGSVCWQIGNHVKDGSVTPLDYIFFEIFQRHNFILRNRIIWRFNFGLNARKRFSGRYETLLWFTKGSDYKFNLDPVRVPQIYPGKTKRTEQGYKPSGNPKGKNPSDFWEFDAKQSFEGQPVWDFPNVKANHPEKTIHPCQFPNEVADRCILALTEIGDTVLDPFAGVGTVVSCAEARSRVGIGFEFDPRYLMLANERLEQARLGELVVRQSGRLPRRPNGNEKVAQVPQEWLDLG
ncbi:DNA-methyltransferase [Sphingopyxis indica]|nr:site-specific DNA-methyltransferase [Sphingopyxis indica]